MFPTESYSNSTICIHSDDLQAIKEAIIDLLEKEGGKQIGKLPDLAAEIIEDTHWIVGLFPAKEGWTIVKTWSSGLLCAPTVDKTRPRLSALAMQLQCDAFDFWVDRGIAGILLETNFAGEIYISGYYYEGHVKTYYNQPIDSTDLIQDFSLLQVSKSLKSAIQINQDPKLIRKQEELNHLDKNDPEYSKRLWDEDIMKGHTQKIDEALSKIIDISGIWNYPDLIYAIYEDSAILSIAKGHLLYFQPPDNYQTPDAFRLTQKLWWDMFGEEPPEGLPAE